MLISINPGYLKKVRGSNEQRPIDECIRLCSEAGFKTIDMLPDIAADGEAAVFEMQRAIEKYGVSIHQGHLPMNRYTGIPQKEYQALKLKYVDAAAAVGARHIVLHADEFVPTAEYDAKAAFRYIYDDLAPVVERAKARGVGIAIENVFEDHYRCAIPGGRTRYTSTVEELLEIIDSFHDPIVSCCWDFGHALVQYPDSALEMLKLVGSRITCTHVHDNHHGKDLHLPPFFGHVNWEETIKYLYQSGYEGSFSYEFSNSYCVLPNELLPRYLRLAYETAEWMLRAFKPKTIC